MRLRPRFELRSALAPDEVERRFKSELAADAPVRGLVLTRRVEITVHESDRHLWSPQLTIDLKPEGDGSVLRARFGPHSHVWTMYMALYAAVGCFITAGGVFGLSQLMLGRDAWGFWGVPIGALMWALVWLLAFVGQGFGSEQMYLLRTFVVDAADADEVSESKP